MEQPNLFDCPELVEKKTLSDDKLREIAKEHNVPIGIILQWINLKYIDENGNYLQR